MPDSPYRMLATMTTADLAGDAADNTPIKDGTWVKIAKLRDPFGPTSKYAGHTGVVLDTLGEVHHISFGKDQDGKTRSGFFFKDEVERVKDKLLGP